MDAIRMLMLAGMGGVVLASWLHAAEPRDARDIPDSAYVVVDQDGHLSVNGQRQRYWAAIGKLWIGAGVKAGDSPEVVKEKLAKRERGTQALLDRFEDLGFNAFRLWVRFGPGTSYTLNDGSVADDHDYFITEAGKRGFRIWNAGLNALGNVTPDDVTIVDDPATEAAWREAVAALGKTPNLRGQIARAWDPRLHALSIHRMTQHATHRNQHNGLRWCDDPVFGVWELSNEEWWMRKMVGGQWQKLPPFFRNQLLAKWNGFLKDKYGDDAALTAAWKALLPGESLAEGTVLLAPMAGSTNAAAAMNDSNPQAAAALQSLDQDYQRDDFDRQRGADVLEFFVGMHLAFKQAEAAALKPLGKSTRLSPWIYDTGIGYEIQSQYLHQNADAIAHDAYVNGVGPAYDDIKHKIDEAPNEQRKMLARYDAERISANDGPWVNWLRKPPGIHQGVPWLEHNRVEGKPYLCYETQIQQPAKWRADFPLRLAALASIQDWDWICWHYFASGDDVGENPDAFVKPMDITTGGHPQGYHYTYDSVQNATMRAAAYMFRDGLLAPAPSPTQFIYGKNALYDPASMDYAGSYGMTGFDMAQTVYQHGVRITIDPSRNDDEVKGPVVTAEARLTHNPYTPTDQITFDWKKGYLMFDAPAAVAWTGMLAAYGDEVKFQHGVTLSDVTLVNPPGIFDPVTEDERYIAFALASMDGKPLPEASRVNLSLVSTSFNSGFERVRNAEGKWTTKAGGLPVLEVAVGATVHAPALDGMTWTALNWSMKPVGQGKVTGGKLTVPADADIWVIELKR